MSRFFKCMLFLFISYSSAAQTRQLNGVVNDPSNLGVSSATVKVKGGAVSAFTTTNAEGKFNFSVPVGNIILQISSVSFEPKEVAVSGTDNNITISLVISNNELGEVVVTALGIKRDKKALGYSVQEVGGQKFYRSKGEQPCK